MMARVPTVKLLEASSRPYATDIGDCLASANVRSESGPDWSSGAEVDAGTEVELRVPAAMAYENRGRRYLFRRFRTGKDNGASS